MFSNVLRPSAKKIEVFSRATGEVVIEKVYGEDAMRLCYGTSVGVAFTTRVLSNRLVSSIYGAYMDSGASKYKIEEYVSTLGINVSECEKDPSEYSSFNEFFARKLKAGSRPITAEPSAVASPGDGRLLVFPRLDGTTVSNVKWAPIRLMDLFNGNESLMERYRNGACGVLRMCPSDSHRFHFPVAGRVGFTRAIPGLLMSVSPYLLEHQLPVFCLNKRTLCELDSFDFGKVTLLEVGALLVGTIVQTYRPGVQVERGEEKGYFKYGGSSLLFFFEKNSLQFDDDLVRNSQQGLETLVSMGERIGRLAKSPA